MKINFQFSYFPFIITSIYLLLFTVILTLYKINHYPLLSLTQNQISSADIILYPSKNKILKQSSKNNQWQYSSQPFLSNQQIQKWVKSITQFKGWSPRWQFPILIDQITGYIFIINFTKEIEIGMARKFKFISLDYGQIIINQQTAKYLNKQIGDIVTITLSFKEFLTSQDDNDQLQMDQFLENKLNFTSFQKQKIFKQEYKIRFSIKQIINDKKMWSSFIKNGALIDSKSWNLIINQIVKKSNSQIFFYKILMRYQLSNQINKFFKNYCSIAIIMINHRSLYYYNPYQLLGNLPQKFNSFTFLTIYRYIQLVGMLFQSIIEIYLVKCIILFFITIKAIVKLEYIKKKKDIWIIRVLGYVGQKLYSYKTKYYKKKKQKYQQLQDEIQEKSEKQTKQSHQIINKQINFPLSLIPNFFFFFPFLLIILYIVQQSLFYYFSKIFQLQYISIKSYQILYIFIIGILGLTFSILLIIKKLWIIQKQNIRTKISIKFINKYLIIIGLLFIYYGIIAFFFIPQAFLLDKNKIILILFITIFILLFIGLSIIGNIITPIICQCIGNILTRTKYLKKYKTLFFRNKSLKQIWFIFSLVQAFMIFFSNSINFQFSLFNHYQNINIGGMITIQTRMKQDLKEKLTPILNQMKQQNLLLDFTFQTIYSNDLQNPLFPNFRIQTPFFKSQEIGQELDQRYGFTGIQHNFLNATYDQYYYPDKYVNGYYYPQLNNGYKNGLGALYNYSDNNKGIINQNQILHSIDNKFILSLNSSNIHIQDKVINVIVSDKTLKQLGIKVGDFVKVFIDQVFFRLKIVHSVNMMPGFNLNNNQNHFLVNDKSIQYFQNIQFVKNQLNQKQIKKKKHLFKWKKVFIKCQQQQINLVISKIEKIAPKNLVINQMVLMKVIFYNKKKFYQAKKTFINIIYINTIISLFLISIMLTIIIFSKTIYQNYYFFLLRIIGFTNSNIQQFILIEIQIQAFVSSIIGILLGYIVFYVWAQFSSQLMKINQKITININQILIIFVIFMILIIFSVKIGLRQFKKKIIINIIK